jgi:hypothetical protein
MKAYKYRNRYGDIHTFTPTEDGNILWEGNFKYSRYGWTDSIDVIDMVDPSGGPYIAQGGLSSIVHPDIIGKTVSHFEEITEVIDEEERTIAYKIILVG